MNSQDKIGKVRIIQITFVFKFKFLISLIYKYEFKYEHINWTIVLQSSDPLPSEEYLVVHG